MQIAYNQTQILFLEKYDNISKVTAASPIMLNELNEEHSAIKDCLSVIDAFCMVFEEFDSERFNWEQGKNIVDEMSKKIEVDVHFGAELKQ